MVFCRFTWYRTVLLGLGQSTRKWPGPPHTGHVLALDWDGSFDLAGPQADQAVRAIPIKGEKVLDSYARRR